MKRIQLKQVDEISRKKIPDAYNSFMRQCKLKNEVHLFACVVPCKANKVRVDGNESMKMKKPCPGGRDGSI